MLPLCRLYELQTNFHNVTFVEPPSQKKQLTTYHTRYFGAQQIQTERTVVHADLYEIIYPNSHPLYEPNTVTILRVDSQTQEAKLNRFKTSYYEAFRAKGAVHYFFQRYTSQPQHQPTLHSEKIPAILTRQIAKWLYHGELHHPTLPAFIEKEKTFNIPPAFIKASLNPAVTKILLSPEVKTYSFTETYLTETPAILSNHPEDFFNPTKPLKKRIESGLKIKVNHKKLPLFEYLFTQAIVDPETSINITDENFKEILTPNNLTALYKYGKEIYPEQGTEDIPAIILTKIVYKWLANQIKENPSFIPTTFSEENYSSSAYSTINPLHNLINQMHTSSPTDFFDKAYW